MSCLQLKFCSLLCPRYGSGVVVMSVCLFVRLRTYLRNNNLYMFDFHQFCGCYTQLYFTINCDGKKEYKKPDLTYLLPWLDPHALTLRYGVKRQR